MQRSPVSLPVHFIVLLLSCLITFSASASIPGIDSSGSPETITNIDQIPKDQVDSVLAEMTDAQARELLVNEVRSRTDTDQPSTMHNSYISYMIVSMKERSEKFEAEFKSIKEASKNYGSEVGKLQDKILALKGGKKGPWVLINLIILLVVGGVVVNFILRPSKSLRENLREDGHYPTYLRLGRSLSGLGLDLVKVALFIMVTIPLTFILFDKDDPLRVLAASILILVAAVWAIRDVLKELLDSPVTRELYIKDDQCRKIYYWSLIGFFSPTILLLLLESVLGIFNFPNELIRLNSLVLATLTFVPLFIGVLMIAREKQQGDAHPDILSAAVKGKRYLLVIAALIAFYTISFKNIVIAELPAPGESIAPGYNYFALLMFIFMPMYLRLIYLLITVQPASALLQPEHTHPEEEQQEDALEFHVNKWVRYLFIIPYVALIFLFMMEGANIGLLTWFNDGAGSEFGEMATGVFIAAALGVVGWNVVNAIINKNLPRIAKDPTALMGSEGGGDEQATRLQTILPILRMVAMALIVIIVTFSILSSLGVNTTPLLAGAGVIGIAIGFGAQKLVQDVVSGLFFLFEDAFRIGEYIDTGSLVGTVESTSLRSLKLRHHLGAVQTIPYGEIRSVKNLSRDFVIMKLQFRVPFGTDIEVVRKTVKKVGQELLKHEELGPDFIAPLKSQGVQTAEDDALVIRMKFTAKPGKQWMIKREAYRLVQEALATKGIEFASRQVTVHVPEAENLNPEALKQAAGAAAAAAAEDANKKPKKVDPLADL